MVHEKERILGDSFASLAKCVHNIYIHLSSSALALWCYTVN